MSCCLTPTFLTLPLYPARSALTFLICGSPFELCCLLHCCCYSSWHRHWQGCTDDRLLSIQSVNFAALIERFNSTLPVLEFQSRVRLTVSSLQFLELHYFWSTQCLFFIHSHNLSVLLLKKCITTQLPKPVPVAALLFSACLLSFPPHPTTLSHQPFDYSAVHWSCLSHKAQQCFLSVSQWNTLQCSQRCLL